MAASIARTSTILRNFCRTTNKSINTSHSFPLPTSSGSNFVFQRTRIFTLRSPARLRREALFLNSLLPAHSVIASACLISKLPTEVGSLTISVPSNGEYYRRVLGYHQGEFLGFLTFEEVNKRHDLPVVNYFSMFLLQK